MRAPARSPQSQWKQRRFHERWYPAETLSVAIGQGYVAATPLQMAQLAAEVATNGIRYKPHFVKRIEALDGQAIKTYEPEVEARIPLTAEQWQLVHAGMCGVVNSPMGTAHKAAIPGIEVCGKTGTAQVVKEARGRAHQGRRSPERYRDHAWFIAYAPGNNPRIAIACDNRARRPWRQCGGAGGARADGEVLPALSAQPAASSPGSLARLATNVKDKRRLIDARRYRPQIDLPF